MDEMSANTILILILCVFAIAACTAWVIRDFKKRDLASKEREKERTARIEQLKAKYKSALKGRDKAMALELGRRYYQSVRPGGVLTIYDEQVLNNDLATMIS